MPKWPGFEFKDKGQFFVISVVIIAISLVSIIGLMDPYADMRLTDVHMHRGDDVFRKVKEGINETIGKSGCSYGPHSEQPRRRDLMEFVQMAEEGVEEEGMYIDIRVNKSTICEPSDNLTINMSLYSQDMEISDTVYF